MSSAETSPEDQARALAFCGVINGALEEAGAADRVVDVTADLKDGTLLIQALEHFEGMPLGNYHQRPVSSEAGRTENVESVVEFLTEGGVDVGTAKAKDVAKGRKIGPALDLLWAIVLRYHVHQQPLVRNEDSDRAPPRAQIESVLLEWCAARVAPLGQQVRDFSKSFHSGMVLCALVASFTDALDMRRLDQKRAVANVKLALRVASQELGVPPILEAASVARGQSDGAPILAYVSYFRQVASVKYAATTHAYRGGIRADGELVFEPGEIVQVIEQDGDWWRGKIQPRRFGWFPAGYVQPERQPVDLHLSIVRSGALAASGAPAGVHPPGAPTETSRSGTRTEAAADSPNEWPRTAPSGRPLSASQQHPASSRAESSGAVGVARHAAATAAATAAGAMATSSSVSSLAGVGPSVVDEITRLRGELRSSQQRANDLEHRVAVYVEMEKDRAASAARGGASGEAALAQEVLQLSSFLEREDTKRQSLQRQVDEEREKAARYLAQMQGMAERVKRMEQEDARRREEYANSASVLEDLIANSRMLPDLMLATTRLEMELDRLEGENKQLIANAEEAQRAQRVVADDYRHRREQLTEEAIAREVAASGDPAAQKALALLRSERQAAAAEKEELRAALELARAEGKQARAESREEIATLNALLKKAKSGGGGLGAQERAESAVRAANEALRAGARPGDASTSGAGTASADDERDEVIAIHAAQRLKLENKVQELAAQNAELERLVETERKKLLDAVRDFDLHKITVRDRDSTGAKYKLQLLNRLRATETERDAAVERVQDLEAQLEELQRASAEAREELGQERIRARAEVERARQQAQDDIERHRVSSRDELEREIRRAEEEVERLKHKAEEEKERRLRLEAIERVRLKAEEERARSKRFGFMRVDTSGSLVAGDRGAGGPGTGGPGGDGHADGAGTGATSPTEGVEEKVNEYKQAHMDMEVGIFATDDPDVYIFGSRKVHMTVLNGQLLVRVGGGYTTIDEFVRKNAGAESRRLRSAQVQAHERELASLKEEERRKLRRQRSGRIRAVPPAPVPGADGGGGT